MRKKNIQNAAFEVATQVRAVEDSLDATLADLALLQGNMVRMRSAAGVSVAVGQTAFEEIGKTLQALLSARSTIGRCHAELVEAKQSIPGLREMGMGDGTDCPPASAAMTPDLRIVA